MAKYKNIVVLTGAGISAESGVATFRDNGGLWEQHRVQDVATPEAFARDPELVQRFYNARRQNVGSVEPNAAHVALANLEQASDTHVTIITQNVDDLHERAGSKNVLHMHGELCKVRCIHCNSVHHWQGDCTQQTKCPKCGAMPALRPHIVWFGEIPFYMDEIEDLLYKCDLFVSVGTSGTVYPAAGFVNAINAYGRAHTAEINLEPSEGISNFAEARHGKAGDLLPVFVEEIIRSGEP
ncbi:NAD-dependent deacylase [Kordiimonas aquimaris]|uniref:NAD-dependent deacylase n=1 Tax=Kordiimonas aquimaris TaxID=707591 RepID=UPI0021CF392B|nr:NAD-dependent deacylase [Kordiimonas aquimaris]